MNREEIKKAVADTVVSFASQDQLFIISNTPGDVYKRQI